jgi:tape measure domain-containing protein
VVTEKVIIEFRADGTRVLKRDLNQIKQESTQAAGSARKLKNDLKNLVPSSAVTNLRSAAGAVKRLGEVQRGLSQDLQRTAASQGRQVQSALAGARATRNVSSSVARLKSVQKELTASTRTSTSAFTRLRATLRRFASSARRAATSQRRLARETRESSKAVSFLKRAFAGLGLLVVARGLIRLADGFTVLTNKLRVVTSSQEELASVQKELFEISQRTRGSVEANAALFSRLALASKDLGISQEEVLQITESLNQAVKISGATASEASAGLLQLAQGIASGTLRGDELRSVLEQLPAVADVISSSLGITRGELRKLGEDGKITAAIIFKAFREARGELEDRFAKTVPTIAEGFVDIRNAALELVGAFNASSGAGKVFSDVLADIADSIRSIARVVKEERLGEVVKQFFADFFGAVTGAQPRDLGGFESFAEASAERFARRFNESVVKRIEAQRGITIPRGIAKDFIAGIGGAKEALDEFLRTGEKVTTGPNRVLEGQLKRQKVAFEGVRDALREESELLQLSSKERAIQNEITKVQNALKKEGIDFGQEGAPGSLLELEFLIRQNEEFERRSAILEQILAPELERAELTRIVNDLEREGLITKAAAAAALDKERSATEELTASLKEEAGLIGLTSRERAVAEARIAAVNALTEDSIDLNSDKARTFITLTEEEARNNAILAEKAMILALLNPSESDRAETLRLINELVAEQNLNEDQRAELIKKTGGELEEATGFGKGFADAFLAIDTSAQGLGASLGQALVGSIDKASGALAEFLVTGARDTDALKEAVSNLLRDLAKEVIQLIIKLLIVAAIKKALGAPAFGAPGAQAGGFVQAGQARIVGEQGPEPFVPTQSGRVLPNQALQPAAAPNITVVNVSDPEEIAAFLNSDEGGDIILNQLGSRNKQARDTLGVS